MYVTKGIRAYRGGPKRGGTIHMHKRPFASLSGHLESHSLANIFRFRQ